MLSPKPRPKPKRPPRPPASPPSNPTPIKRRSQSGCIATPR
jgi:hypothetical protein